ncbi:hypothetical protein AF335_17935 [Streptomyces eurocidicus]|uniref:DNA-binding CsgD family transcriptional regulator/predicted transcriptional regulator n=1 Tax=Streptomyces eurocidicus TaxID=66423 RepID=A0A2N8NUP4_STREU|nr:helix-turn-helix domain-containing protein [Streptomyces eurocidicus]MBB5120347.1 DNA-binding CsgD family transcriptional regulator/predicted transcriptional regulator [Streptomyces eurocidicus]MBF6055980.1 LuxR family transcriptional regulator [Streptomyces eurocidicus]PNE32472.1 hypothetical protein AF335_17935 [Streptomyces eurocidicus]
MVDVRGPAAALGEYALRVYACALERSSVTVEEAAEELGLPPARVARAVAELRELRLLVGAAGSGGGFTAVGPEVARRELTVPLQRTIEDAHRELAGVHERLASFTAALHSSRRTARPSAPAGTPVADPLLAGVPSAEDGPVRAAVYDGAFPPGATEGGAGLRQERLRLANLAGGCRFEILVMLSAQEVSRQDPFLLELLREPLRNKVRTRVLCPHTLRADAAARSVLARLVQDGAQVRTCTEAFDPVVIFDGQAVFLPAGDGQGADGGAFAYEQRLVAFLGRMFERLWEPAGPVEGAAPGYGDTLGDLRATILQLLASGLKDEVIARRVGMSSRTFRRHLAALMQELGAGSRFQAGVRAARLGLVS